MKRLVAVLVSMMVMVGSIESSRGQGSAPGPDAQAALSRAQQTDQQVEKLYGEGKFAEAMRLAEQSLALKERVLGRWHTEVALSVHNLAMLYKKHEAYDKAETLYLRALNIIERKHSPSHPTVACRHRPARVPDPPASPVTRDPPGGGGTVLRLGRGAG